MVYGRQVRGPLDALKEGWMIGEVDEHSAVSWLNQLKERMETIVEMARKQDEKTKKAMKRQFDRGARMREFEPGQMVLVRKPDLQGSLEDSWDGPYEVLRKISPVTYELSVLSRCSRRMVVHINSLKEWIEVEAAILRVVVAEEDLEKEKEKPQTETLLDEQLQELKPLTEEYIDVISTNLETAKGAWHKIDVGDNRPMQVPPHRLAAYWRDQLREEVMGLLKVGVLRPSRSPWSSPIMPVKKPDGQVRLCVDFRKLNAITEPDPYEMPRFTDLLD